jgi:AraC-type DNA-binding domain-containing proteins
MVTLRCKIIVEEQLKQLDIQNSIVELGWVKLQTKISDAALETLKVNLVKTGLELIDDKKSILIDQIRKTIIEMVHYSAERPKINYSEYISNKLGYDYTYLANIFSEVNGITIRQFIIESKIEKVKELILYGEYNLSEISNKLHYSSVAHLSNQFKKITGIAPSSFKKVQHHRVTFQEKV